MKTPIRRTNVGAFAALCLAMVSASAQTPAKSAQNRPPTVTASCKPCTVKAGEPVIFVADAQDPDGNTVTYRWTASAGSFAASSYKQVRWIAPHQAGKVMVGVTVRDTNGGAAKAELTVTVQ